MKEYWVNVYKNDYIMGAYYTRTEAIKWSDKGGVAYRIHVKIKEPKPKFSGYPTYEDIERTKPKLVKTSRTNWMDN